MFSLLRRRARPEIETLRIQHAADCARLHSHFFAHPWSVNEFETMIASVAVFGLAAVEHPKDNLTGFIIVRRAADEAEILTIAVDTSLQRQGTGREMLVQQAEVLRHHGVRRLFLEVDEGNTAARRLYEKFGFAQVGLRPGYYRSASGLPANALILACDL